MTSSENVENKKDKCSASDNVHYENEYHEAHFCALKDYYGPAEVEQLHDGGNLSYRIIFRLKSLLRSGELGTCIYLPEDTPQFNVKQSIPTHHPSPISPSQVNHTPPLATARENENAK